MKTSKTLIILFAATLFIAPAAAFNPLQDLNNFWQGLTGETPEPEVIEDPEISIDTGSLFSFAGEAPSPDATAENPRCHDNSFYVDTDGDVGVTYSDYHDGYYYSGYDEAYTSAEICGGRYNYQCSDDGTCDGFVEDDPGSDDGGSDDGGDDSNDDTNVAADAELDVPQTVDIGEEAQFWGSNSEGENGIDSYEWYVGAEQIGSGSSQTYTFQDQGTFTVQLDVTAGDGDTDTASQEVTVKAVPPQPDINMPNSTMTGEEIILDGSTSTAGSFQIDSYNWNIEGKSLQGQVVETSFNSGGSRTVELTVEDTEGNKKTISREIMVAVPNEGGNQTDTGDTGDTGDDEESGSGDPVENLIKWFFNLFG